MKRQEISDEVWDQNYRAPGENKLEDTWERLARACSAVEDESVREQVYQDFLWLLTDFKGIPGGRITSNLGVEGRNATTLMNCFTDSPEDITDVDSIEGIYTMLKNQALTLKSEGGYGMNFSWIRPAGSYVRGIGGRTPGVLKFMELWDKSSEIITAGYENVDGEKQKEEKKKIRKGAQMAVLSCTHPEIELFIDAKLVPNRLTKFNLSVGITKGFIESVKSDGFWDLKFPNPDHSEYKSKWFGDIEDWESQGFPVVIHKTIRARDLWEKIMNATYSRNDPGVLFLDIANKFNPLSYCEKILTTNPCGETSMAGKNVCLLFSFNLAKYAKKDNGVYKFDFDAFKKAIGIGLRFADNINDISNAPLPGYKQSMINRRRIGLGVLGLGSLFYILGIRYGSAESIELTRKIFQAKLEVELLTSAKLGKEKGNFPLFDKEKYFSTNWWNTLPISNDVRDQLLYIGCMRNSHRAANAPTGNMSIYAGVVSGGIEPVFMKEYARWSIVTEGDRSDLRKAGFQFPDINRGEWFETVNVKLSKRGTDEVLLGSFNGINYQIDKNRGLTKETLVEDYGWSFVKENLTADQIEKNKKDGIYSTTEDLTTEEHLGILKALARYVDMASSKTVNVPANYPYDSFKNLYMDAWEAGVKGITTYRAGTMTAVLEKKEDQKPEETTETQDTRLSAPRPRTLEAEVHKIKLDIGGQVKNAYVSVSFFPGTRNPYEVLVNAPAGDNLRDMQILELSARMTSLSLRHGVPVKYIADQLNKIDGQYIYSIPTSLGNVLANYAEEQEIIIEAEHTESTDPPKKKLTYSKCPKCNEAAYIRTEACAKCLSCGYEKCG